MKHGNGPFPGLHADLSLGNIPVAELCGLLCHLHAAVAEWAHLPDEVLPIGAHVIHTILVDSEVGLKSFMFLQ